VLKAIVSLTSVSGSLASKKMPEPLPLSVEFVISAAPFPIAMPDSQLPLTVARLTLSRLDPSHW
jgi:hypothetical protein